MRLLSDGFSAQFPEIRSSVISFLSVAARDATSPIVRAAPGHYAWGEGLGASQPAS